MVEDEAGVCRSCRGSLGYTGLTSIKGMWMRVPPGDMTGCMMECPGQWEVSRGGRSVTLLPFRDWGIRPSRWSLFCSDSNGASSSSPLNSRWRDRGCVYSESKIEMSHSRQVSRIVRVQTEDGRQWDSMQVEALRLDTLTCVEPARLSRKRDVAASYPRISRVLILLLPSPPALAAS